MRKKILSLFLIAIIAFNSFGMTFAVGASRDYYAVDIAENVAAGVAAAEAAVAEASRNDSSKTTTTTTNNQSNDSGRAPITITPNTGVVGASGIGDIANNVVGAIQVIGYIVAVIMVAYAGIKYLTAGAGTKASVKSDLVPMLVGAILIVGAVTIVGWVWGIAG